MYILRFFFALLLMAPVLAYAMPISQSGSLSGPNDVYLLSFRLLAPGDLHFQTYGYGGSAAAPAGHNAAGDVIAGGGFDPYLSLFRGSGADATFIASNDDGACPPGTPAPVCADATLDLFGMAAGDYTLALTLPFNFSFAENLGTGTLGDGFIGLDVSFDDAACGGSCSSAFAFDVVATSDIVPVPVPGTLTLVLAGLIPLMRRICSDRRKT